MTRHRCINLQMPQSGENKEDFQCWFEEFTGKKKMLLKSLTIAAEEGE